MRLKLGEESRAGVDGKDRREAEFCQGDALEAGAAAKINGDWRGLRGVGRRQDTRENGFLFCHFVGEGCAEHPGVMVGQQALVVVGDSGHPAILATTGYEGVSA